MPQFVITRDGEEGKVEWEPKPFVDRFIMVPPDLPRSDKMMRVVSRQFGVYDTTTEVVAMGSSEAWSPASVPHDFVTRAREPAGVAA